MRLLECYRGWRWVWVSLAPSRPRRHKEAWAAAEQARRDAWSREREAEIKEATVRGLEPEVQRLVARHRGEVRRVEQAMREEHERERERLAEEHRAECRKLRQETAERVEEAVEREREAGAERARVAREAAEAAAAAQRTRLLGECDARVAEAEAARRAERDRAAAEVEACRAAADERVRQVRDALEEERRAGEARVRRALEVQAQVRAVAGWHGAGGVAAETSFVALSEHNLPLGQSVCVSIPCNSSCPPVSRPPRSGRSSRRRGGRQWPSVPSGRWQRRRRSSGSSWPSSSGEKSTPWRTGEGSRGPAPPMPSSRGSLMARAWPLLLRAGCLQDHLCCVAGWSASTRTRSSS